MYLLYMEVHMYIYICLFVYIYICLYLYIYIFVCIYTYVLYNHMTFTYIHIHITYTSSFFKIQSTIGCNFFSKELDSHLAGVHLPVWHRPGTSFMCRELPMILPKWLKSERWSIFKFFSFFFWDILTYPGYGTAQVRSISCVIFFSRVPDGLRVEMIIWIAIIFFSTLMPELGYDSFTYTLV